MAKKAKIETINPQVDINDEVECTFKKEAKVITINFDGVNQLADMDTQITKHFENAYNKLKQIEGRNIEWKGKARKNYDKVFESLAEYMEQTKPAIENFTPVHCTIHGKLIGVQYKLAKILKDIDGV